MKSIMGIPRPQLRLNDYQDSATKTAIYPGSGSVAGLTYTALGLAGEAGEVANKVKKIIRDNGGVLDTAHREKVLKELGGVLWYAAQVAKELGFSLNYVAQRNLDELASRQERGTLQGDGDNR